MHSVWACLVFEFAVGKAKLAFSSVLEHPQRSLLFFALGGGGSIPDCEGGSGCIGFNEQQQFIRLQRNPIGEYQRKIYMTFSRIVHMTSSIGV